MESQAKGVANILVSEKSDKEMYHNFKLNHPSHFIRTRGRPVQVAANKQQKDGIQLNGYFQNTNPDSGGTFCLTYTVL